jgi:predicted dehydrogenase
VVLRAGKAVTAADIVEGAEGLGPLAGDAVHARYLMPDGTIAYYDSMANDDTEGEAYCLQIIGSRGIITLHIDKDPVAHLTPGNPFKPTGKPKPWIPITSAGAGKPEPHPEQVAGSRNHASCVRDLIEACDAGRVPLCDARAGAMTVEMISAVFESHRQGGRAVVLPLVERGNPLVKMRDGHA